MFSISSPSRSLGRLFSASFSSAWFVCALLFGQVPSDPRVQKECRFQQGKDLGNSNFTLEEKFIYKAVYLGLILASTLARIRRKQRSKHRLITCETSLRGRAGDKDVRDGWRRDYTYNLVAEHTSILLTDTSLTVYSNGCSRRTCNR